MAASTFDLSGWLKERGEVPLASPAAPQSWHAVSAAKGTGPRAKVGARYFEPRVTYQDLGPIMRLVAEASPDCIETYLVGLNTRLTARELRVFRRSGRTHPEAALFSEPSNLRFRDFGDDFLERLQRRAGYAAANLDAQIRAISEFTVTFTGALSLGTGAVLGAGALRNLSTADLADDEAAGIVLSSDDLPPAPEFTIAPPARPEASVAFAPSEDLRRAVAQINSLPYDAATPRAQRDGPSTNQRFAAISSIFAGTEILQSLGLLRENGTLGSMSLDRLRGEFAGKAQLESGLDTNVEAQRASTEDRARGLFQFKPETTMALLGIHGHRLNAVEGLIDPRAGPVIESCMHRLAGAIERGEVRLNGDSRTLARVARNYSFADPGDAVHHSHLFYLAYDYACTNEEKQLLRGLVIDQSPLQVSGQAPAPRGGVLSTVLAGLLADELHVPPHLVERYGFRAFGYISHQAGRRGAMRIIASLDARDQLEQRMESGAPNPAWVRADRQLRTTILRSVRPASNPSVYIAEPHRARASFSEAHVMDWQDIVNGIDAMYGIRGDVNLPQAVATLSAAVESGQVRLAPADEGASNSALALVAVDAPQIAARVAAPRPPS